ncbi:hypothetical protein LINPERPRIM_LOCUS18571 [Linum perenne]
MSASKVTLKLLIDKRTNRVVYGEAGKDFVDFLFTILSLPLGTATKLLSKENKMVGTLGNLYRSIEELSDTYIQPRQRKDRVLNPSVLYCPEEGGFVKGAVPYMVMDNLEVKPMLTMSIMALFNKMNIKEVGSIEEKVIELGMAEGLSLLKASLQTESVLTTVFLGEPSGLSK